MKFGKIIKVIFLSLIIVLAISTFTTARKHQELKEVIASTNQELISTKQELTSMQTLVTAIYDALNYKSLPIEKLARLDFIDAKTLAAGKEEMKAHKAVFTGIARDNIRDLASVMRHIEYTGEFFSDYRVIVFENDSSDGTKEIFNMWQILNPKVKIVSEDFFNKKRPSIKFMADIRNRYLEVLATKDYNDFDIVIPIDMDMRYGFDIRGIEDSFSKINQWDVVCSNGVFTGAGNMYDAFAFRDETFSHSSEFYFDVDPKTGKKHWNQTNIATMQKIYPPDSELLSVYSCFGGLAIYKRKFFDGCFYDSEEEDCEHVYLHECMRSKHNARIFMNPAQIIRYSHYN
jgi:hypothetical protein